MPAHHLIKEYLRQLHGRLPAEVVDELADGLIETYDHCRARGLAPDAAARAALAEFGSASDTFTAPALAWPLLLAITASLTRICLTTPTPRTLLANR